jgi:hypothetical protein
MAKTKPIDDRDEYDEQVKVFQWAEAAQAEFPALKYLIGSINGVKISIGSAVKMKKAGLKRGYPDLSLDLPRSSNLGHLLKFHGLRIELKRRSGGKVSPEQADWLGWLQCNDYRAVVCYGSDQAIQEIKNYLTGAIK